MDEYAGRVLAERYRLPVPPADEYEFAETRAFDTYSGQEVLVRQVPLPEVVDAELLDAGRPDGHGTGYGGHGYGQGHGHRVSGADRTPRDPAVRRALEAATAAARLPDHPQLDQVFDVFAQDGSLWIVSERVAARPLAALLAERTLTPHRAAEVAADILTALRALHAHGWTHRNITVRTVLVCDDGRAILTGLAAGAAEEALCGYDPVPGQEPGGGAGERAAGPGEGSGAGQASGPGQAPVPGQARSAGQASGSGRASASGGAVAEPAVPGAVAGDGAGTGKPGGATPEADARRARAGAIAAYQAGTRAAAARTATGENGTVAADPAHPADPHFSPYRDHITAPTPPVTQTPSAPPAAPASPAAPSRPGSVTYGGSLPGPGTAAGARPGGIQVPHPLPVQRPAPEAGPSLAEEPAESNLPKPPQQPRPSERPEHPDPAVPYGRPGAALAAERARQTRINVVGPVTERWAPEQAGPVHANWQLAPPIGPATDLWAVGALLFRIVQGHSAYPEDSAAELVQLVCSEPPSYAEECGALRPVVESLMRQDPADRPDFEELRGWLRSLIRTAPEPEVGSRVVTVPSLDGPADSRRLPILRRRGELVRKGRHKKARQSRPPRPAKPPRQPKGKRPAVAYRETTQHAQPGLTEAPAEQQPQPLIPPTPQPQPQPQYPSQFPSPPQYEPPAHPSAPVPQDGRHPHENGQPQQPHQSSQPQHTSAPPPHRPEPPRAPKQPRPAKQLRRAEGASSPGGRSPRRLGLLLVGLVILLVVGTILVAVLFMPKAGSGEGGADSVRERKGAVGMQSSTPDGGAGGRSGDQGEHEQQPQTTEPADLAEGFAVRKDPEGFQVAVHQGWQRRGENERGQVRYLGNDFELLIVPGRDTTSRYGTDPMAYQQDKEAELAPYRESSWSGSSGLRRIDVGQAAMAEGTFTWQDSSGRQVYVRNLAMIHNGRYHVVQVIGPDNERREVDRLYDQATGSYRPN
ncbi:protein kinase [Streptomyces chrestomyceticus]|uniref:protein kinase n=1 Tax=Streptomyces chrestomyceticus TaxID=68185 RepID=UPI0033C0450F